MKKKAGKSPKIEAAPKPLQIESLDQLQALVDTPLECRFVLDGQLIAIPCKRQTDAMQEKVREITRRAQPPFEKGRNDYNWTNLEYVKAKEEGQAEARSYLIYVGCPAIAAKRPGLTDTKQIHAFVRDVLNTVILDMIELTIKAGGMSIEERTNFTSTGGLES